MSEHAESTPKVKALMNQRGGCCPECGLTDGYPNVERSHFGVCDTHKVFWPIGWNLFSCWERETEADWQRNDGLLKTYRQVEPIHPAAVTCPRCGRRGELEPHHSVFCRYADGTPLLDELVRQITSVLRSSSISECSDGGCACVAIPSRLGAICSY